MSLPVTQLYIALFEQPASHRYHLAFLTSADGKLQSDPDIFFRLFQAIKESDADNAVYKGWITRHGLLSLYDNSLNNLPVKLPLCCIALPPIMEGRRLATAEWWLDTQPAGQEDTPLMEGWDSGRWSSTQWVLRGIESLVAAGILPDKWDVKHPEPGVIDFRHPSWKQLLALAIAHRGDEAMTVGPLITEIRVLEL